MYYTFTDRDRNVFQMPFDNAESAQRFAYKCGYCFCGRSCDIKGDYFEELSRKNIKAMIDSAK